MNIHEDILFQITNDDHIKAEVIYGGGRMMSLDVIENKKLFVIRTYEY